MNNPLDRVWKEVGYPKQNYDGEVIEIRKPISDCHRTLRIELVTMFDDPYFQMTVNDSIPSLSTPKTTYKAAMCLDISMALDWVRVKYLEFNVAYILSEIARVNGKMTVTAVDDKFFVHGKTFIVQVHVTDNYQVRWMFPTGKWGFYNSVSFSDSLRGVLASVSRC